MDNEIPESARELIAQAAPIIQDAELYRVDTPEQYRDSAEVLKQGKSIRNELWKTMRSLLEPVEATEKAIRNLFGPRIKAWDAAEEQIKGRLIAYDRKVETERRAEEERLQRLARAEQDRIAKVEAEKARKARELADRQAAEARAKAEAAAKEARDAEEAERLRRLGEEQAQALLAKGAAKAEAALDRADAAASAPLPTVAKQEEHVAGLSRRKTWKGDEAATLANLKQIVRQAAAGNGVALSLLTLDTKSFQAKAKALGEQLPYIVAGTVVREDRGLAVRS